METVCCLINLPCEMWQRPQPSEQRGAESQRSPFSQGFGHRNRERAWRLLEVQGGDCAWPLLSCSLNKQLHFADPAAFHQGKINVISFKVGASKRGAGDGWQKAGAGGLPAARCVPPLPSRAVAGESSLCLLPGW